MGVAYKVRLEDGVEVGPLDVQMLRSWWQQGMLNRNTEVKPQGGKSWRRLGEAVDIQDWGAAGSSGGRRGEAAADVDVEVEDEEYAGPQMWRTYVASGIFFLLAAGAGYLAFFPDRWLAALSGMPWREIALSSALLGLLLVRGWEAMRKLVRVLVAVLTFSLFPLAGFVVFKGIQLPTVMILVSAWAMGAGLFFFLAGRRLRWTSIALSLLWIVVGAAGIVYFGFLPSVTAARAPTANAVVPAAGPLAPPAPSVAAVTQDVPILTPRAAEAVLARGAATPAEAFRYAYSLASAGLAVLSGDERKELGETTTAAYATLAPQDRERLAAYMERVRTAAVTLPQEDRDMSALMREAVMRLPETQRARLQALYEKAVTAAP